MKNRNTFYIKPHLDYHEIRDTKTHKSIELGCFLPKGGNFCRYYGLYYKGQKPSLKRVCNSLFKKIELDNNLVSFYMKDDFINYKEDVIVELKQTLK